jgi:hypothetical protein
MRLVIALATTVIMFAEAVTAEPNAVLYQLQERCGKFAAEIFRKDYDNGKGDDGERWGYQAHHNARLNKCFFLVIETYTEENKRTQSDDLPYKTTQRYELWDLLENREYGSFQKDTEHGVIACIVQDTLCRSEHEWDKLLKPYMDE